MFFFLYGSVSEKTVLSAQECLNGAPQLGISDDKVDGGGAVFGDQRPLSGPDGNGDVAEGRVAGADGVAAAGSGEGLGLLGMPAVFRIGVAEVPGRKLPSP